MTFALLSTLRGCDDKVAVLNLLSSCYPINWSLKPPV